MKKKLTLNVLMPEKTIVSFFQKVRCSWRSLRPVSASLWSEPILDYAEDLTEHGLEEWGTTIKNFQEELNALSKQKLSIFGEIIFKELKRFLFEQIAVHNYSSHLKPYLVLLTIGILPFWDRSHNDTHLHQLWLERLFHCKKWLNEAARRMANGDLTVTSSDIEWCRQLYSALISQTQENSAEYVELIDVLNKLTQLKPKRSEYPSKIIPASLHFKNVTGGGESMSNLSDEFLEHLNREISAFRTTLSTLCCPRDHLDNSFFCIDNWSEKFLDILSERLIPKLFYKLDCESHFMEAPRILEPMVSMAMFLKKGVLKQFGNQNIILFNKNMMRNPSGTFVKPDSEIALMFIHELCGHAEQLARIKNTLLAELYELTRHPLGFEGWAVWIESSLLELEDIFPEAILAVHFQKVRRLCVSAKYLMSQKIGTTEAIKITKRLLNPLPCHYRELLEEYLKWPVTWSPVVYMKGFFETESALSHIGKKLHNGLNMRDTIETYLQFGPMAPSSIVKLVNNRILF